MTHRCCKSHYVSHFTAFFIVAGAQRSIVESYISCILVVMTINKEYFEAVQQSRMAECCFRFTQPPRSTTHAPGPTPLREWASCDCLRSHTGSGTLGAFAPHILSPSFSNDPSAGSPTETLLRLLLPLNDQVCPVSPKRRLPHIQPPEASLSHSIGSSDGRCVQRAGT